ncbi:MAG: Gldg family protein [Planctomycetaceae bacterium]|jgi:hypothetical protein
MSSAAQRAKPALPDSSRQSVSTVDVTTVVSTVRESPKVDPLARRRPGTWPTRFVQPVAWLVWLGLLLGLSLWGPTTIDLTRTRGLTLSPQLAEQLTQLPGPVEVTIVAPARPRTVAEQAFQIAAGRLHDLVERCQAENPRLSLRWLDSEADSAARQMAAEMPQLVVPGVVIRSISETDPRAEVLQLGQLASLATGPQQSPLLDFLGEQALVGALQRLRGARAHPVVQILTGHGELSLDDDDETSAWGVARFAQILRQQGCDVRPLDLSATGRVPSGSALVIVAGPQSALSLSEAEALRTYWKLGGRGLVLLEQNSSAAGPRPLEDLLVEFGVRVQDDRLVTTGYTGAVELASPVLPARGEHRLQRLLPPAPLVVRDARSVRQQVGLEVLPYEFIPLWVSHPAPRAWGETDLLTPQAQYDPDRDLPGPVSVGCAVERRVGSQAEPVLAVLGDSELISNRALTGDRGTATSAGLSALIHWLVDRDVAESAIPAQRVVAARLTSSPADLQRAVWGTALVLLTGCAVLGFTTWLQTRN